MDENCDKEVEQMEKEAKFKIIQLEDEEDAERSQVLEEAKSEITRLYVEFRNWLNDNVNSQETNERLKRLKEESSLVLEKTKEKLKAFSKRDDVRAGKEKLEAAGSKVVDCVSDGIQNVMENEHVVKVVDTISDKVDSIRSDKHLQKCVKSFKIGTLKVAESAFNGLKHVLEDKKDEDDESGQKG